MIQHPKQILYHCVLDETCSVLFFFVGLVIHGLSFDFPSYTAGAHTLDQVVTFCFVGVLEVDWSLWLPAFAISRSGTSHVTQRHVVLQTQLPC